MLLFRNDFVLHGTQRSAAGEGGAQCTRMALAIDCTTAATAAPSLRTCRRGGGMREQTKVDNHSILWEPVPIGIPTRRFDCND